MPALPTNVLPRRPCTAEEVWGRLTDAGGVGKQRTQRDRHCHGDRPRLPLEGCVGVRPVAERVVLLLRVAAAATAAAATTAAPRVFALVMVAVEAAELRDIAAAYRRNCKLSEAKGTNATGSRAIPQREGSCSRCRRCQGLGRGVRRPCGPGAGDAWLRDCRRSYGVDMRTCEHSVWHAQQAVCSCAWALQSHTPCLETCNGLHNTSRLLLRMNFSKSARVGHLCLSAAALVLAIRHPTLQITIASASRRARRLHWLAIYSLTVER